MGQLVWHWREWSDTTVPGEKWIVKPPVVLCKWGLHGSIRAIDTIEHNEGTRYRIQRAELSGEILNGGNKLAATERTCLWIADARDVLDDFSLWIAQTALNKIKTNKKTPALYQEAIDFKREFLKIPDIRRIVSQDIREIYPYNRVDTDREPIMVALSKYSSQVYDHYNKLGGLNPIMFVGRIIYTALQSTAAHCAWMTSYYGERFLSLREQNAYLEPRLLQLQSQEVTT